VGALGLAARKANPMTAALSIANLRKSFGGLPAMDGVSMEIPAGERRLIIGPNGAGKTTLFNLISGDLRADSGSVRLFGDEVGSLRPDQRAQRGLARTYQIITLFPNDTLMHNVLLSLLGIRPQRWNPFAALARSPDLVSGAEAALDRVGLRHLAYRPLAETSYGERRRVEIAMALAQGPKLLLLDEPFAGLSIDERRDVLKLLIAIPRDVTIIMIEHDMDVALDFAERITVMYFGEILVEGSRAEVVADPRVAEIYLGA
jgi:branched-chain amino acid transport system ATP-binding protein